MTRLVDPIVRGWTRYDGRFYRSVLYPVLRHLNTMPAHSPLLRPTVKRGLAGGLGGGRVVQPVT